MARPCKLDSDNPREREKIQVDFEKLCALQCTREEICAWFDVTDKTLSGWCNRVYGEGFSAIYAKKREKGKISLRRAQFQLAQKSAAMAIFLGRNYLGQKDNPVEIAATVSKVDEMTREIFRIQQEQREEEEAEDDDE